MDINFVVKNVEINPQTHKTFERKLNRVLKHVSGIKGVQLEIREQKTKSPEDRFIASATVEASTAIIRGEGKGDNLLTAVDKLVDVLTRQVDKLKKRRPDKEKSTIIASIEALAEKPLSENYTVKVKKINTKEMTIEKAIVKMEYLDYNFLFFVDAEDKMPKVIYRRTDGDYGLVEYED